MWYTITLGLFELIVTLLQASAASSTKKKISEVVIKKVSGLKFTTKACCGSSLEMEGQNLFTVELF